MLRPFHQWLRQIWACALVFPIFRLAPWTLNSFLKNRRWPCTDFGFVFQGKSKRHARYELFFFSLDSRVSGLFISPVAWTCAISKAFLGLWRRHLLYSLRLEISLWLRCPLEKRLDLEPFGPRFNLISFIIIQWTPVGGPDRGKMKNGFANPMRVAFWKIREISVTSPKIIDFRT